MQTENTAEKEGLPQYEQTLLAYLDRILQAAFGPDYDRVLTNAEIRPFGGDHIGDYSLTLIRHALPPDESCGIGSQADNPITSEDRLTQTWRTADGKPWSIELTRIKGVGLNHLSSVKIACAGESLEI